MLFQMTENEYLSDNLVEFGDVELRDMEFWDITHVDL